MIYENKEEALKSREKVILFEDNGDSIFDEHFKKYEFFNNDKTPKEMGEFFLYEIFLSNQYGSRADKKYKNILTYPKLGLYLNSLPCDQTIEFEWVDIRRTWEWRTEYKYSYNDNKYCNYICDLPTEINRLPLWGDSILIYGVWKSMPDWKQLRQAYERTWWFYRDCGEKRNIQLDRLLK